MFVSNLRRDWYECTVDLNIILSESFTNVRYLALQNSWTVIPALSTGRAGATATAVNGLLYVMGGRTANGQFSAPTTLETVECYDPQTDDWFYVEPMPTSRCEATVVVL